MRLMLSSDSARDSRANRDKLFAVVVVVVVVLFVVVFPLLPLLFVEKPLPKLLVVVVVVLEAPIIDEWLTPATRNK